MYFCFKESVDLKTCRNYYEALEFAKTYLEVSRQQLRTKITLPKWATIYDVGDIVPVTYMSGLPFWDGKLFRIESKEENREEVTLSVREHQPYIYDDNNTGDKPNLPDTTLTFSKPATPTNSVITDLYNDYGLLELSWDSTTSRHQIVITDSDDNLIVNTPIGRKNYLIDNYELGTYNVEVYAIGGLDRQSATRRESGGGAGLCHVARRFPSHRFDLGLQLARLCGSGFGAGGRKN